MINIGKYGICERNEENLKKICKNVNCKMPTSLSLFDNYH